MAEKCGDPTARLMGRITLNPVPHIDPIGTIILPLILIITGSPFLIGWAKPVPVNPYNFRNYRRDTALVAGAGPLSNILLAISFAFLYKIRGSFSEYDLIQELLSYGVYINLLLAFFNLIPFPPLDGSKILFSILPYHISFRIERFTRISPFILLIIIWMIWPLVSKIIHFFYYILIR